METPPRERGIREGKEISVIYWLRETPPRERGILYTAVESNERWKHPRVSGEYTNMTMPGLLPSETPPRERGILGPLWCLSGVQRNTPA